jgi:hypothetical protein
MVTTNVVIIGHDNVGAVREPPTTMVNAHTAHDNGHRIRSHPIASH